MVDDSVNAPDKAKSHEARVRDYLHDMRETLRDLHAIRPSSSSSRSAVLEQCLSMLEGRRA